MDTAIKFLYLSEPDMIRAGVTDMDACVEAMEDLLLTLHKGDYVMGGKNHNSHGCMVTFPDDPEFEAEMCGRVSLTQWKIWQVLWM